MPQAARHRAQPKSVFRLKEQHGPLSSSHVALYVLYFLPTSVNVAWLSFLNGMSVAGLPAVYGIQLPADSLAVAMDIFVT